VNSTTQAIRIGLIIAAASIQRLPCAFASGGARISYGRQVAPIFALHCAGCHGLSNPSSNLRVTRFEGLRAGGDIGDEIVPGHPEESVLMDFIEGKRGPGQRMPQNSPPLSAEQIAVIRQWIQEGAKNDAATGACFDLRLPHVLLGKNGPVEIRVRIAKSALASITLRDPVSKRDLYVDEASVNSPRDASNAAAPGEWIARTLLPQQNWPSSGSLNVRIQYSAGAPDQSTSKLLRSDCTPP
jgi:mono/diheme cytochrome c family protein